MIFTSFFFGAAVGLSIGFVVGVAVGSVGAALFGWIFFYLRLIF